MPVLAAITEAGLPRAMRDPRYLRAGHPERGAFTDWVEEGFQALERAAGRSGGVVFVRAYTRVVNGRLVHVPAHERAARPANPGGILRVQGFLVTPRAPLLYSRPPVGPTGPRVPMERIPRQGSQEAKNDVPSWARRQARHVGESPIQYTYRLMDQHHGGRQAWYRGRESTGPRSDFSRIKKFGESAFRDPRATVVAPDA